MFWSFSAFAFRQRRKRAAPPTPVGPPPPAPKSGTAVLTFYDIYQQIPSLGPLGRRPVDQQSIAMVYDTLRNSVITPPPPWPQGLYKFDHLITWPVSIPDTPPILYFVFSPL